VGIVGTKDSIRHGISQAVFYSDIPKLSFRAVIDAQPFLCTDKDLVSLLIIVKRSYLVTDKFSVLAFKHSDGLTGNTVQARFSSQPYEAAPVDDDILNEVIRQPVLNADMAVYHILLC